MIRGRCIASSIGVRRTLLGDVAKTDQKLKEVELRRPERPELAQALRDAKEEVAVQEERLRCFDYQAYTDRAHAERDKAGRLLAWLAYPQQRGTNIVVLTDRLGAPLYSQRHINARFCEYYAQLYTSTGPREADRMAAFLEDLPLSSIKGGGGGGRPGGRNNCLYSGHQGHGTREDSGHGPAPPGVLYDLCA